MIQDKPHALARADIALAISFAFANLIALLFTWRVAGVQADESMNIYGALRILDGARIYRDFWVYNAPGIFLWTAAVCAILGKSLFVIRLALVLTTSVATAALYLLGRKFMGMTCSLLAPTLFILVGVNLWPIAGYHWYCTLILIFSVLFVARFLEDHSRTKSLFGGSFLAGMTFLFQQPKGGPFLVLLFFLLVADLFLQRRKFSSKREWSKNGLVFVGGVAAPILICMLYFSWFGTLRDAISAFIVFPLRLFSESGGGGGQSEYAGYYGSLTKSILSGIVLHASFLGKAPWSVSAVTFLINIAAPLSIPIAAVFWGVRCFLGKEKNSIALLCSFAALAGFGSSLQKPDFHHLLTTSAPCYLTLAYVLSSVAGENRFPKAVLAGRALSIILALMLVVSSLRIGIANLFFASRIQVLSLNSPLGFIPVLFQNGEVSGSVALINVLDFIQLNTSRDEKIFVMSYSPFIYYLSDRQNPTIFVDIPSSPCGLGPSFHMLKLGQASFNKERLEAAARQIEADKTRLIVVDPAASCQITGNLKEVASQTDPLINYIQNHYRVEAEFGSYVVMMRSG